ncbi:MAG: ribonuclease P protein component [Bacilli bacterium]|jgi:ribonuclease P protein component|nr:ribonuclease P protein component [Bacilli bacterium]MCH4210391.1 ribonuclease P protein component [Bacilli bacterium]MCH4277559.1 ribonuclease P protein component [Bacilli bacterium]MCI2055061.1 ribonuclease P protein component [Bacilli bacterium]
MKRENRVLKYQEFSEIIKSTPYVKSQHYVIHYRKNQQNKARIGISVSKKNGDAVTRNLIKRQIRAIIAHNFDLKKSLDLIIIVKASYDPTQFHAEETELVSSLANIGEPN